MADSTGATIMVAPARYAAALPPDQRSLTTLLLNVLPLGCSRKRWAAEVT
jgi:hypothetical protein